MNLNRIHQIAVYARDLDEALTFYRDTLGAKMITRFDPPGLLFLDFSGVRLLLENNGPKATIYFRVEDIHSAVEELRSRGVQFISEPHMIFKDEQGLFGKTGTEEWMAFFADPSGNTLALASRKGRV
ncbi:MAG TPA: VOC family protein [Pyrinomonadaceae bacterium]|nr:VOC family protein [Pyrinomonadaceae bacterium]